MTSVLAGPADAEVEQGVPDLGRDRDQGVGPAGQPPLDLDEGPLHRWPEIAVEHVAVERVHRPGPVGAGQAGGGETANGARLGHVGVEDPAPGLGQQPADGGHGPGVGARAGWAHQRQRGGQARQRRTSRPPPRRAAGRERRRALGGRVPRARSSTWRARPADVEPGDQLHDRKSVAGPGWATGRPAGPRSTGVDHPGDPSAASLAGNPNPTVPRGARGPRRARDGAA